MTNSTFFRAVIYVGSFLALSFLLFLLAFAAWGDNYFKFPSVVLSKDRNMIFSEDLHLRLNCKRDDSFATALLTSLVQDSRKRDAASIREYSRFVSYEHMTDEEFMEGVIDFYGTVSLFEVYCAYEVDGGYEVLVELLSPSGVKRGGLSIERSRDGSFIILFEAVSSDSEYSKAVGLWWNMSKGKAVDEIFHFKMLVDSVLKPPLTKTMEIDSGGALIFKEYPPSHGRLRRYEEFVDRNPPKSNHAQGYELSLEGVIPFDFGAVLRFSEGKAPRMYVVGSESDLQLTDRMRFRVLDGVLQQIENEGRAEPMVFATRFFMDIISIMRLELILSFVLSLLVVSSAHLAVSWRSIK